MNSNAGLDRCQTMRVYYSINAPLTFPSPASGKPIPQRKNSFTTTLSRPELLISTNITHPHPPPPPPKRENFPRTIHSTHPIPSLRKTTNSVHWTKRVCENTKAIAFILQAISVSAGVATFPVAVRLIPHLQQTL